MPKYHLKRLAAPGTWNVDRKSSTFIVRPHGYHVSALPVAVILREILKVSQTRTETKKIVNDSKVSLDGKIIKDDKLPAGLMSVVNVADKGAFRVLLDLRQKLYLKHVPLDSKELQLKPLKVIAKTTLAGGKMQLGFHDGRTMLSDLKDVKISDTLILKLPEGTVEKHLKLEKNASVYLIGGSSVGKTGVIESIADVITVKIGDEIVQVSKENVFVVGKERPAIDVSQM